MPSSAFCAPNASRHGHPCKPTKERILDAAEAVFAERGYDAASLGDVADRVGIRPQAIYNHYKGKWALYVAVMERLLDPLLATLDARPRRVRPTAERRDASLAAEVALHARNPNLARLVQYATLGGGEPLELLKTRWYPSVLPARAAAHAGEERDREARPPRCCRG